MRTRLEYTEGHWWMRKSDHLFIRSAFLGEWDTPDNYEQVTDAYKEEWVREHQPEPDEEITDKEALEIITSHEEE